MNNSQQILLAARTLIARKKYWTQDAVAVDENHCGVPILHPDAKRFCAIGALTFVYEGKNDFPTKAHSFLQKAMEERGEQEDTSLALFNDSHTHKEVLAVFDRAIELAGGE